MYMPSNELRWEYQNFFKSKGHAIIPSASLIPDNDSTILFTNSGMSPLVPYLMGEKHPGGNRLTNCQKSFRTEDIGDVGDNRHTTFFEMLGNWSLGDYFKKEQLAWWYEFLVEHLGLDPRKLYQSVYAGDTFIEKDNESVEVLKELFARYHVRAEEGPETLGKGDFGPGVEIDFDIYRIFAYRDKNWWQRGDAVGELGGPDSETFYDTGKSHDPIFGKYCHLNCNCGRFLEIGNSVFMQFQKTKDGWKTLENKNVDFGGGLERITMLLQGKDNIFETDLFMSVIKKIEFLSGKRYRENMKAFEIIADHLRAVTFIMSDDKGMVPSNADQGYIARRLIRRALRYGMHIGLDGETWTHKVAAAIIQNYSEIYPELFRNQEVVIRHLKREEAKFTITLEKGLRELEKIHNYLSSKGKDFVITGKQAFDLYQTFGFPIEMVQEEVKRRQGKIVMEKDFKESLEKHQVLSRSASAGKFKGGLADHSVETTKLHTAAHLLLAALRKRLGNHVIQKGSNITSERLRYDFSHPFKVTQAQLTEVEDLINEAIQQNLQVTCEEMTADEAKKKCAIGIFESRYGNKVKVYKIGDANCIFSYEICGGPHVEQTGVLGKFRIIKEESSSSGVRRIKAALEQNYIKTTADLSPKKSASCN